MLNYNYVKVRPLYGKMQRALDSVNSIVQENLIAIRVVSHMLEKITNKLNLMKLI